MSVRGIWDRHYLADTQKWGRKEQNNTRMHGAVFLYTLCGRDLCVGYLNKIYFELSKLLVPKRDFERFLVTCTKCLVFFSCSFFANISNLAHYYQNIFISLFDCFYVFSPAYSYFNVLFSGFLFSAMFVQCMIKIKLQVIYVT